MVIKRVKCRFLQFRVSIHRMDSRVSIIHSFGRRFRPDIRTPVSPFTTLNYNIISYEVSDRVLRLLMNPFTTIVE